MKLLPLVAASLLILTGCKKDLTVEEIVSKTYETVAQNQYGHYTLTETSKKVIVGRDSVETVKQLDFSYKIAPKDTLIGYNIAVLRDDGFKLIYDQDTLYEVSGQNKTLMLYDAKQYSERVALIKKGYNSFPFFQFVKQSLESIQSNTPISLEHRGSVNLDEEACYKVALLNPTSNGKISTETVYYISQERFLPLGLDITIRIDVGSTQNITYYKARLLDVNVADSIPNTAFNKQLLLPYGQVEYYSEALPVNRP